MYETSEQSISISGFFRYLAHHWFIPLIFVVLSPVLGYLVTSFQTPMYTSNAQLVILDSGNQPSNLSRSVILGNYVTLVKSPKVIDSVSEQFEEDTESIISALTVSNDSGTEAISIRYDTSEQHYSAEVVSRIIESFTDQLGQLYKIKPESVVTFTYPVDSDEPYNIDYVKNIIIAVAIALSLSLVITFLRFDRDQARNLGADPLLVNKEEQKAQKKKLQGEKEELHKKEIDARRAELEARAIEAKVRRVEAETRIAKAKAEQSSASADDTENHSRVAEAEARIEAASALKKKVELESIQREEHIKEATLTAKKQAELARERLVELEKINTERAVMEAKTQLSIARAVADRRFKNNGNPLSVLQPTGPDTKPANPSTPLAHNTPSAPQLFTQGRDNVQPV